MFRCLAAYKTSAVLTLVSWRGGLGSGLRISFVFRASNFGLPSPSRSRLFLANDMVRMSCATECRVVGDHALAIKIIKTIIHQGHAFLTSGLNGVFQLMNIILADQIPDSAVRYNLFVSQHAPCAIRRGQ